MSKICSYAQGFAQMRKASEDNEWNLKLGDLMLFGEKVALSVADSYKRSKMLTIIIQDYKTYC